MSDIFVIDDSNYQDVVADGVAAGLGTGWRPGTKMLASKFSDSYSVIPRDQWPDLIKQGQGTFLSDLIKSKQIPVKNQRSLGYCWVYASTETVETCRAIQNQPYVDLSPESIGGPLTGWRNEGGDGLEALDQLTKVGACASSFMDAPNSLSPKRWKAGWQDDCVNHKITMSWTSLGSFDEVMTALFLRMPASVGLSWWSHQVLFADPHRFSNGGYGVVFRNSWGNDWPSQGAGGWSTLTESKSQPMNAFAAISTTVLDKVQMPGTHVNSLALAVQRQEHFRKTLGVK